MLKKAHDAGVNSHRALACPNCRREINVAEMFLVLPTHPATSTTASSSSQDAQKGGSTTKSGSPPTTTGSQGHHGPQWSPALSDDAVKTDFSRLPDHLNSWDGFSGRFLGLPRTMQTLLRVAGGVDILGCAPKSSPSHQSAKIARLLQDVRAVDGKVVVCTQFSKAVSLLMFVFDRENIPAVKVTRGEGLSELTQAIERFTTDPLCKVLVLHSGSGAAGLTLTVARHVFLLEPFLRAGEEAQALNRVHRIGQTQTVNTKCYFMRGTIEERLLAWRSTSTGSATTSGSRPTTEEEEEETGLIVLAEDDQAKSVAGLSPQFLSYVLGASDTTAMLATT